MPSGCYAGRSFQDSGQVKQRILIFSSSLSSCQHKALSRARPRSAILRFPPFRHSLLVLSEACPRLKNTYPADNILVIVMPDASRLCLCVCLLAVVSCAAAAEPAAQKATNSSRLGQAITSQKTAATQPKKAVETAAVKPAAAAKPAAYRGSELLLGKLLLLALLLLPMASAACNQLH